MPSLHKRIHLEQLPPLELVQPLSKKQKLNYLNDYHPPTAFWDNLSKIWLTRRALEEFYRRNTQPARCSRANRPVTRHAVAKWKHKEENWEPTRPTADFLTCFSVGHSEEVKLLTRHDGPDLSDLRGVCIARCPVSLSLIVSLVSEIY
jgi:hypothetical protein